MPSIAPIMAMAAQVAATSPQAAVQVVVDYYDAINRRDYRAAYSAWDRNGAASGQSFARFRAGFAQTKSVRVVAGTPSDQDGGMNQRWITIPVDVYAALKSGKRQHFRGSYTLRRVAEGVGAPQSQLSWHISSANLRLTAD